MWPHRAKWKKNGPKNGKMAVLVPFLGPFSHFSDSFSIFPGGAKTAISFHFGPENRNGVIRTRQGIPKNVSSLQPPTPYSVQKHPKTCIGPKFVQGLRNNFRQILTIFDTSQCPDWRSEKQLSGQNSERSQPKNLSSQVLSEV